MSYYIHIHTYITLPKLKCLPSVGGPGNVVGIATGYDLDGPGIESR